MKTKPAQYARLFYSKNRCKSARVNEGSKLVQRNNFETILHAGLSKSVASIFRNSELRVHNFSKTSLSTPLRSPNDGKMLANQLVEEVRHTAWNKGYISAGFINDSENQRWKGITKTGISLQLQAKALTPYFLSKLHNDHCIIAKAVTFHIA